MPCLIYIHWHRRGAKHTICKADAAVVPLYLALYFTWNETSEQGRVLRLFLPPLFFSLCLSFVINNLTKRCYDYSVIVRITGKESRKLGEE